MNARSLIYFMIPSLVWGSTWYAIKFQIGYTDPLVSVGYRFAIAGLLILLYCLFTRRTLRFPLRAHLMILFQALCLFGFNYWLVYMAEEHLTSALVAVIFSMLIFTNIFFNRLVLKAPVRFRVVLASLTGFLGVILLFKNEITFSFSDQNFISLLLCIMSVILASFGNILSVFNLRKNIPMIQTNALGMLYGGGAMMLLALAMDRSFAYDMSWSYTLSLLYLAVFGSIVGFGFYLKIQSEIGPDKAGYVAMVIPVVALGTSTLFEGYTWTPAAALGALLIVAGNALAIGKKKKVAVPDLEP